MLLFACFCSLKWMDERDGARLFAECEKTENHLLFPIYLAYYLQHDLQHDILKVLAILKGQQR